MYLCGENGEAKQTVAQMAIKLGLTVLDKGSLSSARELEDFPLKLFPEWRLPLSIAAGLSAFFLFYLLIRDVIYAYVEEKNEISYRMMVALANKVKTCPLYLVYYGIIVFILTGVLLKCLSDVSNCSTRYAVSLLPAWCYSCFFSTLQRNQIQVRSSHK